MAEEVVCTDVANLSRSRPNSGDDSVRKERVDLESEMEMGVNGGELTKDILHISQGNENVCFSLCQRVYLVTL